MTPQGEVSRVWGTDRQDQALALPETRNWPLTGKGPARSITLFYQFLPLWEQSERKGLPLPGQEGGGEGLPFWARGRPCWVGTARGTHGGQA